MAIAREHVTRNRFCCASRRSPPHACITGIGVYTCCCGGKAGKTITNASIGSIAMKGCHCGTSGRGVTKRHGCASPSARHRNQSNLEHGFCSGCAVRWAQTARAHRRRHANSTSLDQKAKPKCDKSRTSAVGLFCEKLKHRASAILVSAAYRIDSSRHRWRSAPVISAALRRYEFLLVPHVSQSRAAYKPLYIYSVRRNRVFQQNRSGGRIRHNEKLPFGLKS